MPTAEYLDKAFNVDEEGFLRDLNDWCPEWVEYVRVSQGISKLGEEHWKLIHILQLYYKEHGFPPPVRILTITTGYKMKRIFELFPAGPGKGACKMAGLPKPKGCV
jgi:dissimilatory sulfite reductase related protein